MDSTSNPDTHESCMQYLLFPQMNLHCRQKSGYQDPDDGRQRFLLELEIRSCLVNPTYIPLYPHCLFFLELLQNPSFLNAIAPSSVPPASLPSSVAPAASPTPAPTPVTAAALFR